MTTTYNPRAFSVCVMTDDGRLRVLFQTDSPEQADEKLDHYADMFPNALVDVYPRSIMLNVELAD